MKSIEEAAKEFSSYEPVQIGFNGGVEFAHRWIPVEEELPPKTHKEIMPQSNGNTLTFFHRYIVKGYYKNGGRTEDVLMACYRPYSVGWYFLVEKQESKFAFVVTHWRPIEYK